MLKFKANDDYLISAKHYLHVSHSAIANMHNVVAECHEDVMGLIDFAPKTKITIAKPMATCMDLTGDALKQISDAARADYKNHAHTVEAHKRFIQRWEDKINSSAMRFLRAAKSMLDASFDFEHAAAGTDNDDGPAIIDEEEMSLFTSADHKEAVVEASDRLSSTALRLASIAGGMQSHQDFIDDSSARRNERLNTAAAAGRSTLAQLIQLLRVNEIGSLSAVRDIVASAVQRQLNETLTKQAVDEEPRMLTRDYVASQIVQRVVDVMESQMLSSILGAINSRVTDDEEEPTVGSFVNDIAKPAVERAFKPGGNLRSSAIAKINETVLQHVAEELERPDIAQKFMNITDLLE